VGIGLMLEHLLKIPFSVWIVILNIPFFLIGYKKLGARMIMFSAYSVIVLSLVNPYFEEMDAVTEEPFLSTIFGGIIIGIGVGLVIRNGGSLDGTEILAITLDRKLPFSVGQIVMFFNIFILGAAGFVFSWNSAMYSLVAYFICSRMIDTVEEGMNTSKGIFIVTSEPDAVADAIVNDMGKTVTIMEGVGGYKRDSKGFLYCVIPRLEITEFKQVVHDTDPGAFLSMMDIGEVQGGWVRTRSSH